MIGRATLDDVPEIAKIIVEFQAEKDTSQDPEAISLEADAQLRDCLEDSQKRSVFVARGANGEALGYLVVHWIPFPAVHGLEGYISDLIVGSQARGRGLGRALLQSAEEEARSRGAHRLMLNNRRSAESYARQFYAKNGFSERVGFSNFIKQL
jgi:ribosomal protein S18 acetylase RimI-like enzyme